MTKKAHTTHGIKISVEVNFIADSSDANSGQFVFAYNISIENHSEKTVQLLRRHWIIKDSNGITKEVKGDGVIGEQPIIQPNRIHEYGSWAKIESEIGKMYGSYLMQDTDTKKEFEVEIPAFELVAPYRMN